MAEAMTTRKLKATKKTGNRGANKLNEVAFKNLEEDAEQIGQALKEAAAKGNVMSTRLLIELAEKFADAGQVEMLRPFHALLQDLAAEPEWPAEALEAAKEAAAGKKGRKTA